MKSCSGTAPQFTATKAPPRPLTGMDVAGHQLLARAGLAGDQHRHAPPDRRGEGPASGAAARRRRRRAKPLSAGTAAAGRAARAAPPPIRRPDQHRAAGPVAHALRAAMAQCVHGRGEAGVEQGPRTPCRRRPAGPDSRARPGRLSERSQPLRVQHEQAGRERVEIVRARMEGEDEAGLGGPAGSGRSRSRSPPSAAGHGCAAGEPRWSRRASRMPATSPAGSNTGTARQLRWPCAAEMLAARRSRSARRPEMARPRALVPRSSSRQTLPGTIERPAALSAKRWSLIVSSTTPPHRRRRSWNPSRRSGRAGAATRPAASRRSRPAFSRLARTSSKGTHRPARVVQGSRPRATQRDQLCAIASGRAPAGKRPLRLQRRARPFQTRCLQHRHPPWILLCRR